MWNRVMWNNFSYTPPCHKLTDFTHPHITSCRKPYTRTLRTVTTQFPFTVHRTNCPISKSTPVCDVLYLHRIHYIIHYYILPPHIKEFHLFYYRTESSYIITTAWNSLTAKLTSPITLESQTQSEWTVTRITASWRQANKSINSVNLLYRRNR